MEKEYFYKAEVVWREEKKGLLTLEGKPALPVSAPPEFGGAEGLATPQELFVSSAVVCLMTTFAAMAQKVKLDFLSFSCRGEGKVEPAADKGLVFTKIDLYPLVRVKNQEDVPAALKALDLAKRYCIVTNSMKTESQVHPEVKTI